MAFDLGSSSFTKEEWLDDAEIPRKIEEEVEKKADTALNVVTGGETSGHVEYDTISEVSKKEDVEIEQVFKHEEDHLYYSSNVNYDTVSATSSQMETSAQTPFAFNTVDFKTTSKKSLKSHKNHHPARRYVCGICSYETATRDRLQDHMINHANKLCPTYKKGPADPRFLGLKCRQCDYVAENDNDLTKHVESHIPPSRLTAKPACIFSACGFEGENEDDITWHNSTKHQQCKYCELVLFDMKTLKGHLENFHNAKPQKLLKLIRSSRFTRIDEKRKWSCQLCGSKPNGSKYREYHMQKVHNAIMPESRMKNSGHPKPVLLTGNGLLD